jgi:serine-type D-Ala-D-Ala carboxypeptidase (penicillin-binding protein 5/6)
MKLILTLLFALLLPFAMAGNALSASQSNTVNKLASNDPGAPPKLSARAFTLYDHTTGQVLYEENSHERIEPASLTKLMTAYIAFSSLRQNKITLSDKVTPSIEAIRTQRSDARMYLERNKTVTIAELLRGLIIISANDAARALAETIAKSEINFVELMNKEAKRLGMNDTHFVNASGMPDAMHYSSAHDLALLASAIITDFPEHTSLYAQKEYEYNNVKHYNRNRLLWLDPHVDGMKTGHTESAGYSLVATANRNNHRLISVVIATSSDSLRSSESQRLLNHGYQNFEIFYLYKKDQAVSNIRLWKGTENSLKVGIKDGLSLTLPKGQRALLSASIETQQPLLAPISDNQQVGVLKLTLDGKPYLELPLVALEPVAEANILARGIDNIRMIFSK